MCSGFSCTLFCLFVGVRDLRYFKSEKTNRGVLKEGWIESQEPIMCSYKLVTVKFEVWGLQTRVEQFVHKVGAKPLRECFFQFQHCVLSNFSKLSKVTLRPVVL